MLRDDMVGYAEDPNGVKLGRKRRPCSTEWRSSASPGRECPAIRTREIVGRGKRYNELRGLRPLQRVGYNGQHGARFRSCRAALTIRHAWYVPGLVVRLRSKTDVMQCFQIKQKFSLGSMWLAV